MPPVVSVLIPMRNEEHCIARCLDSVLANDYPKDRLEILVIDGMSTDWSREIIRRYTKRYSFLRLLKNPRYIQAAALNIGLGEAKGEIIIRMDAHAVYAQDYISQCVRLLQTTDAANVGGVQRAVGTGYVSDTIAVATTLPFGIGDARFRYSDREEWVDTVYLGAWYKKRLETIGGFNEEWVVNEDYELNYRLRQAGGKILLSPKICCHYYVRGSLKTLVHQYFRYGLWKVKTLVAHPDSLRWRHLVPPLFVLSLVVSSALIPVFWVASVMVPGLYIITNLAVSFWTVRRRGWRYLPLLPFVFAILHVSWGVGFWVGLVLFRIPHFSLSSLLRSLRTPERERGYDPERKGRYRKNINKMKC